MAKALNVVFGVGISVVIFILVLLAVQAFYPAPRYEDFCDKEQIYPRMPEFERCPENITVAECNKILMEINENEMQNCYEEFMDANKIYNRNFFIIVSLLGVLAMVIAFFLLNMESISSGVVISGIALIFTSFIRGWQSTDDKLKFFVGLIISAIVIALAVSVNKRISKQTKKRKK